MARASVRISPRTYNLLKSLSNESGESIPAVLEKAVEAYRRQQFLEELNSDFQALRRNPKAWAAEQRERADWDRMLGDDLGPE